MLPDGVLAQGYIAETMVFGKNVSTQMQRARADIARAIGNDTAAAQGRITYRLHAMFSTLHTLEGIKAPRLRNAEATQDLLLAQRYNHAWARTVDRNMRMIVAHRSSDGTIPRAIVKSFISSAVKYDVRALVVLGYPSHSIRQILREDYR